MKLSSSISALLRVLMLTSMLFVAAASSCSKPEPQPEPEPEPEPEVVKSEERKNFEESSSEGLYMKGSCVLAWDENTQQKSWSPSRKTYRIQNDNQMRYVHIAFTGAVPSAVSETADCTVHYSISDNGDTMLIVKFVVVKVEGDLLWLWNELQKLGVIIPVGILS